MSLNCDQIRERLHDQLDDQLDAESVRQVESHLAACEHCRKVAEALADTRALMRELGPVEAPEGFAADLAAAIRRTPQEPAVRRRSWRSPGPVLASLSMAAAVMFVAVVSAPYFNQSRTQVENLDFEVMDKTPVAGSAVRPDSEEREAPSIATGDEGDSHLYAKEGGKRALRGDLKRLAESPNAQRNTKKADRTNDDARDGWGAAQDGAAELKSKGAKRENSLPKESLGATLEKLAKSKNEEHEKGFADDQAEGGEVRPNNAPSAPPAARPSADPATAPGTRARAERAQGGHQKQDAPSASPAAPPVKESAPQDHAETQRPAKKSPAQEPTESEDALRRKSRGAAKSAAPKPAAPKADVGRVAKVEDAKRDGGDGGDAGSDRNADKDQAKYRSRGSAGAFGGGKGGAPAPDSAPRSGGAPAGGPAAPGSSAQGRHSFAGRRGHTAAPPIEETGEVILMVANVAPDSPQARRLLAYLGANGVPAASAPAKLAGKLAEVPGAKKPTEATSEEARSTRKLEQQKALDELATLVKRLRTVQQGPQPAAEADADEAAEASAPAQRGSTIDARLPLAAWKRLNQGVLQTMGLHNLVKVTSENPAPQPKATAPNGPSAPGALPADRSAVTPVKVVRILVVFEPAPARESKGK